MNLLRLALGLFLPMLCLNLQAAESFQERLRASMNDIDVEINRDALKKVTPLLAGVVKLDKDYVEKFLAEKGHRFSHLALARLLADKTSKTVQSILTTLPTDWAQTLKDADVAEEAVFAHLDKVQEEIAFIMVDYLQKKKK
jgi:hypothetical protein